MALIVVNYGNIKWLLTTTKKEVFIFTMYLVLTAMVFGDMLDPNYLNIKFNFSIWSTLTDISKIFSISAVPCLPS